MEIWGSSAARSDRASRETRHDDAALVGIASQVGHGDGGPHVDDDDRRGILGDGGHGAGHDIAAHLSMDVGFDIKPRLDPGAHDHWGLAGEHPDCLKHGACDRGDHAGHNRACDGLDVRLIECEYPH